MANNEEDKIDLQEIPQRAIHAASLNIVLLFFWQQQSYQKQFLTTAMLIVTKKMQVPQRLHYEECHIVCTLPPDGICVDVTMHMLTYLSSDVFVSMVDHAKVVHCHGTEVVRSPCDIASSASGAVGAGRQAWDESAVDADDAHIHGLHFNTFHPGDLGGIVGPVCDERGQEHVEWWVMQRMQILFDKLAYES